MTYLSVPSEELGLLKRRRTFLGISIGLSILSLIMILTLVMIIVMMCCLKEKSKNETKSNLLKVNVINL